MRLSEKISKLGKWLKRSPKEKKDKKKKQSSDETEPTMKDLDYYGNVKNEKESLDYTGLMNGAFDTQKSYEKQNSKDASDKD